MGNKKKPRGPGSTSHTRNYVTTGTARPRGVYWGSVFTPYVGQPGRKATLELIDLLDDDGPIKINEVEPVNLAQRITQIAEELRVCLGPTEDDNVAKDQMLSSYAGLLSTDVVVEACLNLVYRELVLNRTVVREDLELALREVAAGAVKHPVKRQLREHFRIRDRIDLGELED